MRLPSSITSLLAKTVIALAIVSGIGWAVMVHGDQYLSQIAQLHWPALVAGLMICCAYRVCNAHGWWLVLRALHQRVPAATALRLWLSSEACRWLPGSVWNFGSRALLGARSGVAPVSAIASLALELGLTLLAWAVVAAACLPRCGPDLIAKAGGWISGLADIYVALATAFVLVAGGCVAWFCARHRAARKAAQLSQLLVKLYRSKPDPGRCLLAFGYYVTMAACSGLGLHCLIWLISPAANIPVTAVIGANAAAWLAGFSAIVAPGGLVVREGSLALVLAAWVPLEQAVYFAVVWRLLQIAAELLCVLIVFSPTILRGLCQFARIAANLVPLTARELC